MVKEETKPPCSRLYIPDKKSLLFEVSYYKNRINFEVYHALTDGTGAMHFLQELVQNYLILAHPSARSAAHRAGEKRITRGATRRKTAFLSIILRMYQEIRRTKTGGGAAQRRKTCWSMRTCIFTEA